MEINDSTRVCAETFYKVEAKIRISEGNWYLSPAIFFSHISKSTFLKMLKDPHWIGAPKPQVWASDLYFRSMHPEGEKLYKKVGRLTELIKLMLYTDHPLIDEIVNHSDGLLLRIAISTCDDFRLKKMSLRGLKSKDALTRKAAVSTCPHSKVKKFLKDPRKEVRLAAVERLGMHNIAEQMINDKAVDIRLRAAVCLEDVEVLKEILDKEADKIKQYTSWKTQSRITKIMSKMSKQDVVYNLDFKEAGSYAKKMIEAKLYSE